MFKMELKINLGNFQNVTLSVDEQKSWDDCQKSFYGVLREYQERGIEIGKPVLWSVGLK